MTFKTAVTAAGYLKLGEAAERVGFGPDQTVEVIVTRSGALIVARVDDANAIAAPYRSLPPGAALPAPRETSL